MCRRIGIEAAGHYSVEHAEKVILVGCEPGVAAPTDSNLWQIVQLMTHTAIVAGAALAKCFREKRFRRNTVGIAIDVGDHITAMNAPSLLSMICKILNLPHLPLSIARSTGLQCTWNCCFQSTSVWLGSCGKATV